MRREIPIALTVIAGLVMLLSSFFASDMIDGLSADLSQWIIIISALMLGIASVNLIRIHGNNIARRRPGWFNSIALLAALFIYGFIGIMSRSYPDNATWNDLYSKIFNNIQSPLGAAMFAIIAFYVASASYRAFRARSLEATVLLVAAVLVMLGKAPIGELVWAKFPTLSAWLLKIPNTAGQRAIMIGAAIGAFVTSLRVMLGLERGHLGGVE